MSQPIGTMLFGIGTLHTLFSFVKFSPTLKEILAEGVINTSQGIPERGFAIWFLYVGLVLLILGLVVGLLEKNHIPLPRAFAWSLLSFALLGAAITPVSGFWLLIVPALFAFRRMDSQT